MGSVKFIGFRGIGLLSKAIRFFTRSPFYSHIAYLDKYGRVIECWPTPHNKMQAWTFSKMEHHHTGTPYEIWEMEVPAEVEKYTDWTMYRFASMKIKYDWTGCIGFVFKLVKDNRNRLFCSEGCITPLIQSLNWKTITAEHVSPQNFINIIEAYGAKIIKGGVVGDDHTGAT